jgi:hypothetical protein
MRETRANAINKYVDDLVTTWVDYQKALIEHGYLSPEEEKYHHLIWDLLAGLQNQSGAAMVESIRDNKKRGEKK